MAALVPNGKQYYTNNDGTPLIGGQLFTYVANTLTPKTTYSDAAGTIPNTNPVVLDGRGEAFVFWSGTYDIVLQDANGATIYTVGGVNSAGDGVTFAELTALLGAAAGSALIGFQQDGAGAIITTLSAEAKQIRRITQFGASPLASPAQNTTAIQNAVNLAGKIIFPNITPGGTTTYQINLQSGLVTPEGGTGIGINVGSDTEIEIEAGVILQVANSNSGTGAIIGNTNPVTNVCITGSGVVDGNNANVTGNLNGVVLWNATNCRIQDITVQNFNFIGAGFRATASGYGGNKILNTIIDTGNYIGIQCNRQTLGVSIINNTISNTTDNNIDYEGNNVAITPQGFGDKIIISQNKCTSGLVGIFIESAGNCIITNNHIYSPTFAGMRFNRINSGADNNIITGNHFKDGAGLYAIGFSNNSGRCLIEGNLFDTWRTSIQLSSVAYYLSVGLNYHKNISERLITIQAVATQSIRSRILQQHWEGAKDAITGRPFTASPLTNSANVPARSFRTVIDPMWGLDYGAATAVSLTAEYQDGISGVLQNNVTWGAFSIYSTLYNAGGETLVNTPSTAMTVGSYVTINGTLFKISALRAAGIYAVQNSAGVDGDYTATTNGAYPWVEYYPDWQTT